MFEIVLAVITKITELFCWHYVTQLLVTYINNWIPSGCCCCCWHTTPCSSEREGSWQLQPEVWFFLNINKINEQSRSNQPWSNQRSYSLSVSLLTLSGGRMIGSQIWSQIGSWIGSWIRTRIGFWIGSGSDLGERWCSPCAEEECLEEELSPTPRLGSHRPHDPAIWIWMKWALLSGGLSTGWGGRSIFVSRRMDLNLLAEPRTVDTIASSCSRILWGI